jgi:hypothetical protein
MPKFTTKGATGTETALTALVGALPVEPTPKPAEQADEPRRHYEPHRPDAERPLVGAPPAETLTPKLTATPMAEDADGTKTHVELPPDAEPLITRHAAAVWLAVCDDQITRLVNKGELDGVKMGNADGVRLKIVPASVRALIERRRRRKAGTERGGAVPPQKGESRNERQ